MTTQEWRLDGPKCPCRFNDVCGEREQKAQTGWARHGMAEPFGKGCPWWAARIQEVMGYVHQPETDTPIDPVQEYYDDMSGPA